MKQQLNIKSRKSKTFSRKAQIWTTSADVFIGGMLIALAFSSYFLISFIEEKQVQITFEEKIIDLKDDSFVTLLKADINGYSLSDLLIHAHLNNDDTLLKKELDGFLEKMYSDRVCWVLYNNQTNWLDVNVCRQKIDLLDADVIMPLPNNETMHVRLYVKGFAE